MSKSQAKRERTTKEARGKEANHAKAMEIKAKCIPHIVGKGGAMIRKIAAACHGHVALPSAKESEPEQVDLRSLC